MTLELEIKESEEMIRTETAEEMAPPAKILGEITIHGEMRDWVIIHELVTKPGVSGWKDTMRCVSPEPCEEIELPIMIVPNAKLDQPITP